MLRNVLEYVKDTELRINIYKDKVNIVNYDEIIDFTDERISIRANDVMIIVKGKSLIINKLVDNEILILGKILNVELR